MKKLRHIAFIFAVVLGLTFSVSAQKGDDKKRPPKNPPPTVDPAPKPPRGNPPKEKPGRPGMAYFVIVNSSNEEYLS